MERVWDGGVENFTALYLCIIKDTFISVPKSLFTQGISEKEDLVLDKVRYSSKGAVKHLDEIIDLYINKNIRISEISRIVQFSQQSISSLLANRRLLKKK